MTRLRKLYPPDLAKLCVCFWRDLQGQDMIEYALMAAFVAVASAAVLPEATPGISTVLSKIGSVLTIASAN